MGLNLNPVKFLTAVKAAPQPSPFVTATVTKVSPLMIQFDGEDDYFGDVIVACSDTLAVSTRVICTRVASRWCITNVVNPRPNILPVPHAKARQAVAQSLPNNTVTLITFDTKETETVPGMYSAAGITVPVDGLYDIDANLSYVANATGARTIAFQLDSTPMPGSGGSSPGSSAVSMRLTSATTYKLNAGQIVRLLAFQNSGGALLTGNSTSEQASLAVTYVGPAV